MPQIEIVVSSQGQSQVETKGFSGASCRAASQFIEVALGQSFQEQLTAAFHQPEGHQQTELEPS
jgi:hypothetical protein